MNLRLRLDIHWSSVRSSSNPPGELPAQVTRMSIFPKRASVASTQRWTSAMTLMSPAIGTMACPVAAAICFAAVSSGSAVRAVMTTSAPSCARCSATARPMPLLAPVTKATFTPTPWQTVTPTPWQTVATHAGKDGWYIKYQAFNRASPRRVAGLGRHPPGSRGLAHGRRGAGATGPEARGVYGGRWPRYARVRPTDAAAETHTFAAAGAGHVTPAYARHRCRYGLTRSRRALATLRPRTPHGRRYGKLTRSRRQTLGHTTPHGN